MSKRKNILFFMTDQFQWNALGYAGHPIVKTPNLDQLAAESVNFPNTFCASPVCVPARISLFSGQYPHKHGQATNLPVREGTPMLIDTLNDNGYHTAAVGKLHLLPAERETKRFQTLALHDGYSKKGNSAYVRYLEKEKPEFAPIEKHAYPKQGGQGVIKGKNLYTGEDCESIIYGTSQIPLEHCDTRFIAEQSMAFLERHGHSTPFFLFTSFLGPHSPFVVPEPYDTMYDPSDMPVPDTIEEDFSDKPESQRSRRSLWGMEHTSIEQLRRITALYYAHITLIDDHIGMILDKLKGLDLYDDTIIVFSADHGEFLGHHGLFYKGCMYDEATRIPLIIHDAGQKSPSNMDTLFSQIDIMPTLLDLAGVAVPEWSQGVSRRNLVNGSSMNGREEVFFEIKNIGNGLGYNPSPGYITGVRDHNHLFSHEFNALRETYEGELYDLRSDPTQTNNLYHSPKHAALVQQFKERTLNWFMSTQ